MKKLLGMFAGLLASVAYAGDYHVEHTLRCSECHTMHASRSHGLNTEAFEAEAVATFRDIGVNLAGNRNLLIDDGTNATCLACHDGQSAFPDVLGTNEGLPATMNVRSAGALNATTFTAGGGYDHFDGHTLGSDAVPPGFVGVYEATPQENFNCANCHAVHGSKAFRNLGLSKYMGLPGQSGTDGNPFRLVGPKYNMLNEFVDPSSPGREAAAPEDHVFIETVGRTYATSQVVFMKGDATGGMNGYCGGCHGNFHGDSNTRDLIGGIDFVRHPTSGVERAAGATGLLDFGGQVAQKDLVRPAWVAAGETGAFEAACLSCHKGHGNKNGYGLIYPDNTGLAANFEDGDAAPTSNVIANENLRNLCVTCHAQGRDLDDPSSK